MANGRTNAACSLSNILLLMMNEAHTSWKQNRTTVTLVANALGSAVEESRMGDYTQHPCVCVCSLKRTHAECEWLTIVTESPLKRIRLSSEWTFKITVFQSSLPGLFGLIPSTSDIWDLSWSFVTFPVFWDASNHHDIVYQPFLSRYLTPLILAVVLE